MVEDMETKAKATITAAERQDKGNHFVSQYKIVFDSFLQRPKTTLEAALETGVLRNCITWHVAEMEKSGLIQVVKIGFDPYTGFRAAYYSTDSSPFEKQKVKQLNFFDKL